MAKPVEKHDASYYMKCMVGGIFACGLTHTFTTPLDLVKCRRQVQPGIYSSLGQGLSSIKAEKGLSGLYLGWQPTFVGYSMQGFGKFGFYEIFKDVYRNAMGTPDRIRKYQTLGFAVSSACAEIIADTLLCPWEAVSPNFSFLIIQNAGKIKLTIINLIFLYDISLK